MHDMGKVLAGNWDTDVIAFEELDVYRALRDRFVKGVSWEQTSFFHNILNKIESGTVKWDCRNKQDLVARTCELDALYREIKNHGYKLQSETPNETAFPYHTYDEVSVCIGRNGQFLFDDGRHRLSIAKILKLQTIPVQVTTRHKEWDDFRQQILAYAEEHGGMVYSPLLHPDLSHIPSVHGHKRFDIIKSHLPLTHGDLLDIGAHWGYFCHRFEAEGFNCYAVESAELHLKFLEKLKQAEGKRFHIIRESIFDYREKTNFDVVLALNILHHFLKTKSFYTQLVAFLNRLDMQVMYLGTHCSGEGQMKHAYRNFQPAEFVDFILSNSCLNQSKLISITEDNRELHMLWK